MAATDEQHGLFFHQRTFLRFSSSSSVFFTTKMVSFARAGMDDDLVVMIEVRRPSNEI